MTLRDTFEASGNWLFRWRSYAPIVLFIPLLVEMRHFDWPMHRHELQFGWEVFCIAVSTLGLGIRALTVGYVPGRTSGRNTKQQVADSLNTTGVYSIVRHPLYLGNFFAWLGFALFSLNWLLIVIFALAFWLYYERIMFAEEEFLRRNFSERFETWAANTPAFIPQPGLWRKPALPFSIRTVLRREYPGLLGVIAVFFLLDLIGDWFVRKYFVIEAFYLVMGLIGLAGFVILRTLKKRTAILDVVGR